MFGAGARFQGFALAQIWFHLFCSVPSLISLDMVNCKCRSYLLWSRLGQGREASLRMRAPRELAMEKQHETQSEEICSSFLVS